MSIVNVMGVGTALALHRQFGWSAALAIALTTGVTLVIAGYLAYIGEKPEPVPAPAGD